ncbi:hypothetical protein M408DRAFT_24752 [Serendipita vermifera MAFF 305830]|uniref:Uncharacterized protein n=1 Tax=Serendipita vermifera MAFF 305830 TaxID=933852 RepID=A0A0C3ART6_SERVB|nr:hypothetical protein M408DRAFT_24752 [Serendipita vermifera MAFF 305830]
MRVRIHQRTVLDFKKELCSTLFNTSTGFSINAVNTTIEQDKFELLDSTYLNAIREHELLVFEYRTMPIAGAKKRVKPGEKPKARPQFITRIKSSDSPSFRFVFFNKKCLKNSGGVSKAVITNRLQSAKQCFVDVSSQTFLIFSSLLDTSLSHSPSTSSVSSAQIHAVHFMRSENSTYSEELEGHMRNIATEFYDLTILHELQTGFIGGETANKQPLIAVVNRMTAALDGIQL